MAQGKRCPQCGYYMFAADEKDDPEGRWVFYECKNEHCKYCENVYEQIKLTYHPLESSNKSLYGIN